MIKKSKRLNKESFNDCYQRGVVERSANFLIKRLKDPKNKGLFALSAPKKDFKTALERNKVRRRIFSAIKDILSQGREKVEELQNNYIFIAKKGALNLEYNKLVEEITAIIGKINK